MGPRGELTGWYGAEDGPWVDIGLIAIEVDASDYECYALTSEGYVFHGDALTYDPNDPIVSFTVGPEHDCFLRGDGSATCGGANDYGEGDVPEGAFLQLSAGDKHTCAVTTDGFLACWGLEQAGVPIN